MPRIISIISANTVPGPKRVDPTKPNIFIIKVDGIPSSGGGVEAPLGTIAIYKSNGVARKFFKAGSTNVAQTVYGNIIYGYGSPTATGFAAAP